jgi:AcrR family transcriptional regulator
MAATTERKTAEERREEILDAALTEFAERGFHGASTDTIARRAGVSQPYVFRLFGTKKELYVASVERCFRETEQIFLDAAQGLQGEDALHAMGRAYMGLLADRTRLQGQMQAYAACSDPEICDAVRAGFGSLYELVERVSGAPAEELTRFFALGMLLNVVASMDLLDAPDPWVKRLMAGCPTDEPE